MSQQLFTDGETIKTDQGELECSGVTYQELDGVRHSFVYQFRLKSDMDEEREKRRIADEEEAERQAELERANTNETNKESEEA